MFESGKKLTKEDINKLESKLGFNLPNNYKEFLLEHNGGKPEPDAFRFTDVNTRNLNASDIDFFLGINLKKAKRNILEYYLELKEKIPNDLLPIGFDTLENHILIGISNENSGKIFFLPIDFDKNTKPSKISDNFKEFVEKLQCV